MLVQPENRGTGIAIAAATLMLSALDPEAIVAFLPCDHHHSSDSAFRDVIEAGMFAAHHRPDNIILVGAEA